MSNFVIHAAGLDVERGHEEAFDAWHETSHIPAVLDRTGWQGARIYRCLEGEPSRLTIFDLDESSAAVAAPKPFLDDQFGRWIRNYRAQTMRRIFAFGEDPASSELVNLITTEVDDKHAKDFSRSGCH